MALAPNTDNYTLGKGVVYFDQINDSGVYLGERDLGNAPAFNFNIALEKLQHFSSRGGLKAKDKEIISQVTPGIAFTLDELSKENMALLTMGDITEVDQEAGLVVDTPEEVVAHLGRRLVLGNREIGALWLLDYTEADTASDNVLFVAGETVTGIGGAEGVVVSVTGTAASGTLALIKTNTTDFVDGELLSGDAAGVADADGIGVAGTVPNILVTDLTGATVYEKGTDYTISTTLKDDTIGRIYIDPTGTITEGETLKVSYAYGAATYTTISAFANTQLEGRLRFVSDNPAGSQQELEIWRVSLAPEGDTALIGDDWGSLGFTGEILKDETNHPTSPYMNIIMA
jgi:hypothetical protein